MSIGCALTIVRARRRRLAKLVRSDGTVEGYDRARVVDLLERPVADLADLHRLLARLLHRPNCCVLRGAPADPARTRGVRRLLHADPETGEAPTLREVPRRWLALDIDGLPLPAGTDPRDLAASAAAVVPLLPAAFHGAACIVQATASHALKPGARLRLWFWLSRPLLGGEAKRWLAAAPVDRSVFGAVQPIFTAAPLFDGLADPLPDRLLLIEGAPVVHVPDAAALAPPPAPPRPTADAAGLADRHATLRLAGLLHLVASAPDGHRHRVLFWAACRAGEMVRAGIVGPASAADALADAAIAAGGQDRASALRTALDGIARGAGEDGRHG